MDRRTRMWPFRRPVTRYFDPLLRPVAGRLPAFGIVSHRGRKTGKVYETPVNVFMRDGDYVFFLTYGSDVHWVKNILASGSCVLRTRGRDVRLVEPELIADPQLLLAPRFVRFVEKRLAGVTEVLRMRPAAALPIDVHELRRDELPIVSEALTNRSARTHRARLELQERGAFTYLIAWHEGLPIGHVGIEWRDDRRPERIAEYGAERALVHDLEVLPGYRDRGVGRTLMLELEDRVRVRGFFEIGLSTGLDDGYAAARHLYRSLGYAERQDTLHIASSRSSWDAPGDVFIDLLADRFKTL